MKVFEESYLALRWNNHDTAFKNLLQVLRQQEIYTDVSLACEKKLFHVHKFVLSTCSESFKGIFSQLTSKPNVVIYMKDVRASDLECILDFMYKGEVHIAKSELGSLLRTAENLQVKGLTIPDDTSGNECIPNPENNSNQSSLLCSDTTRDYNSAGRSSKRSSPVETHSNLKTNQQKRVKLDGSNCRNNNINQQDTNQVINSTENPSTLSGDDADLPEIKKEIKPPQTDGNMQENIEGANGIDDSEMNATAMLEEFFKSEYMETNYYQDNLSSDNSDISTAELLQVDLDEDGEGFLLDAAELSEAAQALVSNTVEGTGVRKKPFACTICPNTFTRRDNLTNHIKTHLGERPHMCPYCKKCFTRKDYLKQHERIHTGEKPFQCTTCGRAFTRKEGLTDHMRCHSDYKEFSCDICGKEFKQKCGLRFHKRNYHQ